MAIAPSGLEKHRQYFTGALVTELAEVCPEPAPIYRGLLLLPLSGRKTLN